MGEFIRSSLWLFPVIEAFHLVAFAVLGGVVLLVDLRLLGLVMRTQPTAQIAQDSRPFLVGSLSVMLVSGTLLFLSEAVKCYYSFPFRVKISSLALAILFTWTLHRRAVEAGEGRLGPFRGRLVAVVSLVLWGVVAWAGRWIGFSG
ncbi:MAG: hypothetical protein E4G90_08525 [Gemmatimonadales bacterium]|nr:MAG: hypothetical protein E4G90_08525 [Gemmatimonadales bacterium]